MIPQFTTNEIIAIVSLFAFCLYVGYYLAFKEYFAEKNIAKYRLQKGYITEGDCLFSIRQQKRKLKRNMFILTAVSPFIAIGIISVVGLVFFLLLYFCGVFNGNYKR